MKNNLNDEVIDILYDISTIKKHIEEDQKKLNILHDKIRDKLNLILKKRETE